MKTPLGHHLCGVGYFHYLIFFHFYYIEPATAKTGPLQIINNMGASFVNPAFIKFCYAKVIIAWLNLVTNSLLVVPKGWIPIGDYSAAKPSARKPTAVVGFGQMSEHQVLKNVREILRAMIGDNGSIYFFKSNV